GPRLPRDDRDGERARYCRLMLSLFKPWRTAHDLKVDGCDWVQSFKSYKPQMKDDFVEIIENMRLTHECRDSRDD
ncbi:hypothetical protein OH77DRAFT_1371370, partial [Trametes cingulata]